jgi:hypothetical protein
MNNKRKMKKKIISVLVWEGSEEAVIPPLLEGSKVVRTSKSLVVVCPGKALLFFL